jgi:hypothetical protein
LSGHLAPPDSHITKSLFLFQPGNSLIVIKNNEEPIHLCEQDSIIYANSYNDSRVKTDSEIIDFEVWQRNLLSIAESENKKFTRA